MKIRCSGCTATWGAVSWAHCSVCHSTFTAVTHFDAHRTDGQCWAGWEWQSPIPTHQPATPFPAAQGATPVPAGETPTPVLVRRCAIPPRRKGLPPPSHAKYLWEEDGVYSTMKGHLERKRKARTAHVMRDKR